MEGKDECAMSSAGTYRESEVIFDTQWCLAFYSENYLFDFYSEIKFCWLYFLVQWQNDLRDINSNFFSRHDCKNGTKQLRPKLTKAIVPPRDDFPLPAPTPFPWGGNRKCHIFCFQNCEGDATGSIEQGPGMLLNML